MGLTNRMIENTVLTDRHKRRLWEELTNLKTRALALLKSNFGIIAFLTTVYMIALFPLFRANFNYRDDGGRVLQGFDDWDNFGRWITNTLSHAVHADTYLRDISPLTQILAVLIMVAASIILLKVVRGNKKLTLLDAVCVLPLGLFPYFLCCFSYKYDSPYMALSVLVSILPLVFRKNREIFYCLAVFIGTLLMCTTYQASAGIFPMVVAFTVFLDWKNGEKAGKIARYCLFSALSYIVAMLVFLLLIPHGGNSYVAEKVSFNTLSIQHIFENYVTYFSTFKSDYLIKWFAVIALISVMFFIRNLMETKRKWIWTLIASGAVYIVILLLSFGTFPLLDEPFTMPRGMYGICTFVALICLGATPTIKGTEKKICTKRVTQAVSLIVIVTLSWMCIVFSCTYGNALAAQKSYDDFRISEVATELAELPTLNDGEATSIQIVGTAGYAAGIKNIPCDRILLRLVPPPFGGENGWSYIKLLSYYGLPNLQYSEELSKEDYTKWDIAHENCYHTIYTSGDKVVVELKEGQ